MKLIKTTVPESQGTSTIIDKDGITVSQSGSDWAYIQSDTPFYRRDGKYAYEVTLISITNKTYGASFAIANNNKYPKVVAWEGGQNSSETLWFENIYKNDGVGVLINGGITFNNGDVVGVCWDFANNTLEVFINGVFNKKFGIKTIFPYLDFSNVSNWPKLYPAVYFYKGYVSDVTAKVNFGQEPHKYTYDGYIDPYYETIPNPSLKQY